MMAAESQDERVFFEQCKDRQAPKRQEEEQREERAFILKQIECLPAVETEQECVQKQCVQKQCVQMQCVQKQCVQMRRGT